MLASSRNRNTGTIPAIVALFFYWLNFFNKRSNGCFQECFLQILFWAPEKVFHFCEPHPHPSFVSCNPVGPAWPLW